MQAAPAPGRLRGTGLDHKLDTEQLLFEVQINYPWGPLAPAGLPGSIQKAHQKALQAQATSRAGG